MSLWRTRPIFALKHPYMSVSKKITLHLGKKKVKFEIVPHKTVFTAYDLAQTLGEKLEKIAKTLLVSVEIPTLKKKEKRSYLVVVPATYYVDLEKVRKTLKATKAELAPEKVMAKFGITPGALSPFGSVRGLGVVVDKALLKTKEVIVGAESFTEHLRMKIKDLVAVEAPIMGMVGKKSGVRVQKPPKRAVKKVRPPKGKPAKKAAKKAAKKRK